jgi:hypothetical protein
MIQPAFGKHDIYFSYKNVDDILHPEYDVTLQGQILTPDNNLSTLEQVLCPPIPDSNLTDIRMGFMSPGSRIASYKPGSPS